MPWLSRERPSVTDLCRKARHCLWIMGSMLSLTACSVVGDIISIEQVKPWQRGALAREDMQLVNDPLEQAVDDHIYFSREASTGGVSLQGGGCGCN